MNNFKHLAMVYGTIILLVTLTFNVKAQNPDARFVRLEFFGQPYYHGYNFLAVFPNDTISPDSLYTPYCMQQTFANYGAEYLVIDDGTPWSQEGPFDNSYPNNDMWMWLTYPYQDSLSTVKIANGFINKIDNPDTLYPGWMIQASDIVDFYYRRKTTDDWIYLNPIADTLMADSTYLPPIFIKSIDTLDMDGDDYVFCFQLKMVYQPEIVDAIPTFYNDDRFIVSYIGSIINLSMPNDTYTLTIYDLSGKIIYRNHFVGENYDLPIEYLQSGVYIYSLKGRKNTYTGKFYK